MVIIKIFMMIMIFMLLAEVPRGIRNDLVKKQITTNVTRRVGEARWPL